MPAAIAPDLVLVGLGGNLDEPLPRLRATLDALAGLAIDAPRVSSFWRSAPVDCPPGSPDFVNAVAALRVVPSCDPVALLDALLALEQRAGRVRGVRNAPRALDLDLLLFGARTQRDARLELPHPRAHRRAFVMVPAAELEPSLRWPGTNRTLAELAAALDASGLRRLDA